MKNLGAFALLVMGALGLSSGALASADHIALYEVFQKGGDDFLLIAAETSRSGTPEQKTIYQVYRCPVQVKFDSSRKIFNSLGLAYENRNVCEAVMRPFSMIDPSKLDRHSSWTLITQGVGAVKQTVGLVGLVFGGVTTVCFVLGGFMEAPIIFIPAVIAGVFTVSSVQVGWKGIKQSLASAYGSSLLELKHNQRIEVESIESAVKASRRSVDVLMQAGLLQEQVD